MTLQDGLLEGLSLKRAITPRLRKFEERSFPHREVANAEHKGWIPENSRKTVMVMRRDKTHDEAFEDRVWAAFALLGFSSLNAGRNFKLSYGNGELDTKQVDVLALDGQVALVVECKSSTADRPPTVALKDEIELLRGYQEGFRNQLRREYPGIKVRFILATNNLTPNKDAEERLKSADIVHLTAEDVDYYLSLGQQLGKAAKHQLLGDLFQGTKIQNMDSGVAAVEGRMGGKKYYSFLIEPERLLQIAFVLHHRSGQRASYQRVIKKNRLKKVSAFIESGGMFPSSIVVNLESGGRGLRFERGSNAKQGGGKIGTLHLPQKYRSAFVIDGQHRLYGYADSPLASDELIPVVAFVDLPASDQVELFMQINENQQAVPKNLRTALNADLLWTSPNLNERASALRSRVAQDLADDRKSPLHGRVISGEDSSGARTITLASITRGLNDGNYIGRFTQSQQKHPGLFFRVGNDQTYPPLRDFLFGALSKVRESTPTQWNLASEGLLFRNPGVIALLTLVGELVDHQKRSSGVDPLSLAPDAVLEGIRPQLDVFAAGIESMPTSAHDELKASYGSTAPQKYLRFFQSLINDRFPTFQPAGFVEWKDAQSQDNRTSAFDLTSKIEAHLNADVKSRLENAFGAEWRRLGVPDDVFREANKIAVERQLETGSESAVDWWTTLYLVHYDKIIRRNQANFEAAFGQAYTPPSLRGAKRGSWRERAAWLSRLNDIRNSVAHGRGATSDDVHFLEELNSWLVAGA